MTPSSAEGGGLALEPCPFCGEAPLEDRIEPHEHSPALLGLLPLHFSYPGSWSIECVHCECRIFSHESRERAVERWNRRAANHFPALVEALESIAKSTCCGSCQEAALVARAALSHAEQVKP